jgi:two-component system LytT family response regulator
LNKIRALIVDDEPLARARIRDLLRRHSDLEVVGECTDGFEAVSAIIEKQPDLVFLDVQMPEKDGLSVLEEVGADNLPAIVFVTAYDHYALRAFQVHALDYLLKPFDEARFEQTLQRVRKQIQAGRGSDISRILSLLEDRKNPTGSTERLLVKEGGRLSFLKTEEVDWIEAEGNYVKIHSGASAFLMRETMGAMESQLDPRKFMRIHRRAIVQIDRIKQINQMFHGEYRVVLLDGTELSLSRKYRDRLPRIAERLTV